MYARISIDSSESRTNALNFCFICQEETWLGGLERDLVQLDHLPENDYWRKLACERSARCHGPTGFDDVRNRLLSPGEIVIERGHLKFQGVDNAI